MAIEGTLDLFKLPEILQLISQQRKTGILTVQGQQDIIAVSFLNGRIVAADALNQTLEEGLSEVLVAEGMIGAPDLARAASEHQAAGGRLIDLLVERRYLEHAQLLAALRLQTYRLLEQLLGWSQGDFKFYSGDEVSYEEGFDPISVEELLINAAEAAQSPPPAEPEHPAPSPASLRPVPVAAPPAPRPAAAPAGWSAAAPGSEPVGPGPGPAPAGPRLTAVPRPAAMAAAPAAPPEEEGPGPFRRMKVEPRLAPSPAPIWTGGILAGLLAILVVWALLRAPNSVLLPFPWQEREREDLARDQRTALYLKIDHAAKTWFLLEGSFPDRIQDLVSAGLLSPSDRVDPEGRPLQYLAGEESYILQPVERGHPVLDAEVTEAITGNFLLDPEFLRVPPESAAQPLVLLD